MFPARSSGSSRRSTCSARSVDHDREARVLNRLGDLSRKVGEVADSERFFREALPLAREVDDPVTTADILNNSGLLMMSLGRAEEAIQQLQSAIPLAQEVDSANVEAALTLNIGDAYDRPWHVRPRDRVRISVRTRSTSPV